MERNERKANSRTQSISVDRDSKFILRKICLDFLMLFCGGFLVLAFHLWGSPFERGFFCDDESLKHPYKDSTVTSEMLYTIGIVIPCCTMCLLEWIRLRDYQGGRSRTIFKKEIPAWLWEIYKVVGIFLFGCVCQQLTTDVAKYTIGRLRPHFFNVCIPDTNCSLPMNKYRYIETFECLGTDKRLLKEMRLSFPSGHSSFSAYTMIYFAMYLQKRFTWRGSKLIKHSLQFIFVIFGWYTAMSRISDYKHHWSDVLAGFSIGVVYAVVFFVFLSDVRKSPRTRSANHDAEMHVTNGNSRQVTGWQV